MRLIIAGSRTIEVTPKEIEALLNHYNLKPTEIVSGTARGVDRSGEEFASLFNIPIKRFPANWDLYGKSAGHKRNCEMGAYADALLLIWDGYSRGSLSMKSYMDNNDKPVYEVIV
jgi:hypothetical protein